MTSCANLLCVAEGRGLVSICWGKLRAVPIFWHIPFVW